MKLNLDLTNLKKTPQTKSLSNLLLKTGYESPVGWWEVTTEGDCEGRTVTHLGTFYGHVAEIAFTLADKCSYSLRFSPLEAHSPIPAPVTPPRYTAVKDSVWISLDIESGTWNLTGTQLEDFYKSWLNVTTPKIKIQHQTPNASYFAAVNLQLI